MKKKLLPLFLLMCSNLFAQDLIVLEKTLEGQFIFNSSYDADSYVNLSSGSMPTDVFFQSTIQGNSIICKIYDTDYNLTTETYTFNIPTEYMMTSCTQVKLPNTSESDIYLVSMINPEKSGKDGYYRIIAYNGDGEGFFEFNSATTSLNINPILYKIKGQYKLIVSRMNITNNQLINYTDIYVLNTKNEENSISKTRGRGGESSQIFDISGKLIYEASEEQLKQIALPQGIYIQKDEDANTKKFFVE